MALFLTSLPVMATVCFPLSVCLFGDTTHAIELRFAALAHTVEHLPHYLEMVCTSTLIVVRTSVDLYTCSCVKRTSPEGALQLATVFTSDAVFSNRPCDAFDRERILKYA